MGQLLCSPFLMPMPSLPMLLPVLQFDYVMRNSIRSPKSQAALPAFRRHFASVRVEPNNIPLFGADDVMDRAAATMLLIGAAWRACGAEPFGQQAARRFFLDLHFKGAYSNEMANRITNIAPTHIAFYELLVSASCVLGSLQADAYKLKPPSPELNCKHAQHRRTPAVNNRNVMSLRQH